jgi:hypothetical protein
MPREAEGSSVFTTIKNMLEHTVDVAFASSTSLRAEFSLSDNSALIAVSIAEKRNAVEPGSSSTVYQRYMSEAYRTDYTPIDINLETEKFVLYFDGDEIVFGKWIKLTPIHYLCIHIIPDVILPVELTSNGVKLFSVLPDTVAFTVADVNDYDNDISPYMTQGTYVSATTTTKTDYYRLYKLSLRQDDTDVDLSGGTTLQFPIPAEWDMDKLIVVRYNLARSETAALPKYVADKTNRIISVDAETPWGANAVYLIGAIPPTIDLSDWLDQGDGVYHVGYSALHSLHNRASMSNEAFAGHTGYFEMKDGTGQLYIELTGVEIGGTYGYLSKIFSSDGQMMEPLAFRTTEHGALLVEDFPTADVPSNLLYYPSVVRSSVVAPSSSGGFYGFTVIVPIMDGLSGGLPGGGAGAQQARLLIHTIEKVDNGINPLAGYDKSVIAAAIVDAQKAIAEGELSEEGMEILTVAIEAAQAVLDSAPTDSGAIKDARDALAAAIETAKENVGEPEPPDLSESLEEAVANAEAVEGGSGYLANSYEALTAALAAAKTAQLAEAQMAAQIVSLDAARAALVSPSDLAVDFEDGTHSIPGKTKLLQYASNNNSMGNPAIDHNLSYVEINGDGAQARVHLYFNPLTASAGNLDFTGYLLTLDKAENIQKDADGIITGYTTIPAQVHENWGSAHDDYWKESYGPYPKHLSIPVTPGEETVIVHVFVPVMEAISAGSGDQLARLIIDWSGFELTAPDAESLNMAIAQAESVNANGYTALSYAALTASVAAGNALKSVDHATQTMFDARTAAILAAKAALIPAASAPETVDKDALNSKLAEAKAIARGSYTDASWNALQSAINAAQTVADNADATQAQADAQVAALQSAINGLTITSDPGPSKPTVTQPDINNLADGIYSIGTALRHYSLNQASMGHAAIDHSQSRLVVRNGQAEVRLTFQALEQRLGAIDFVGYLLDLWKVSNIRTDSSGVVTGFDTTPATVYSQYTGVTDEYGPPAGRTYPKELGVGVNIGDSTTIVQVFVPVMDAITPGSGTQLARLQLDWDSLSLISSNTPSDPPATEPPATEPPVTEPPATEPPVTEPPVTEPPVTEPAPPVAGPDPNAVSTAKVVIPDTIQPDENGKLTVTLPDAEIEAAIAQAQTALAEAGEPDTPVSLLITPPDRTQADETTVKSLAVSLSAAAVTKLEETGVQALEIQVPGSFQFVLDAAAITEIHAQLGEEPVTVTLSAEPVVIGDGRLDQAVQDAVSQAVGIRSNRPVLDFSLILVDAEGQETPLTQLETGTLTRTIAYPRAYYENPAYLHVFRAEANGDINILEDAQYDESGVMVWTGQSCSLYGVTYTDLSGSPLGAPEKVQLIRDGQDPAQYDYHTVLPGGVNRDRFVNAFLGADPPSSVLLLAGGLWYDVNGITLVEARDRELLDDPFPVYQAVLENGAEVGSAAAEIIDRINAQYPLTREKLSRIYALYLALPQEERAVINSDRAVIDMLELLNIQ